jgi:hypothetical protein
MFGGNASISVELQRGQRIANSSTMSPSPSSSGSIFLACEKYQMRLTQRRQGAKKYMRNSEIAIFFAPWRLCVSLFAPHPGLSVLVGLG